MNIQKINTELSDIIKNPLFNTNDTFKHITTRATNEKSFKLISVSDDNLSEMAENMKEINKSMNGFGKLSSQYEKSFFTLVHQTPYRNLKQILAEIESRRGAIKENEWRIKKDMIKLAQLEEKIHATNDKYKKALLNLEYEKKQSNLSDTRLYFEGAIKELYHLQQLFEEIKANHGIKDFDEIDVEEAEEEYHIKRGFEQAYQNMNDNNTSMGLAEQEYLLQNGINPVQAKLDIIARINEVQQEAQYRLNQNDNSRITMDGHYKWLDDMVEKYKGCSKDVMKRKGIDSTFSPEICFKNDDKLKLENKEK